MIHIVIGTKAQFIKMAPIMQRLQENRIPYNLIDLGQHSLITSNLRNEFNIKEPDICLSSGKNISKMGQGLLWMLKLVIKGINLSWVKKNIFLNKKGICLIHGDTVSTVLGLYLAKRAGLKVAHIEAGLRSYNYLDPFPEEFLRVLAMKFSDILFVPTPWALDNLKKMGLGEKSVLTSGNTTIESTFYSLQKKADLGLNLDKFALFSFHRMQNIFSKRKLIFIVDIIEYVSMKLPVVFVQHQPTLNQLKKFKLQEKLDAFANVHFFKIVSHAHFVNLLNKCEFVVTDGGSIQEESCFLDKPCLFLRKRAEWIHGVGKNVVLFDFSKQMIDDFLSNYKNLHMHFAVTGKKPSEEILEKLQYYA